MSLLDAVAKALAQFMDVHTCEVSGVSVSAWHNLAIVQLFLASFNFKAAQLIQRSTLMTSMPPDGCMMGSDRVHIMTKVQVEFTYMAHCRPLL